MATARRERKLAMEARKRGKATYWQWRDAKRFGESIEYVIKAYEKAAQEHRQELAEYERYVYDEGESASAGAGLG